MTEILSDRTVMDFIGIGLFILIGTVVVLGIIAVIAFLLVGALLKVTTRNTPPPLTPEEKNLKIVNGHRDPIRFFGEAGLSRAIRERAGNRCEHEERGTRCPETQDLQLDHIFPWFHGGWTILSNAQVLCTRHNRDKGADIPSKHELFMIEMRRSRTFKDGMLMPQGSLGVYWKPNEQEKAYRMEWLKTNSPFVHVPGQFKR